MGFWMADNHITVGEEFTVTSWVDVITEIDTAWIKNMTYLPAGLVYYLSTDQGDLFDPYFWWFTPEDHGVINNLEGYAYEILGSSFNVVNDVNKTLALITMQAQNIPGTVTLTITDGHTIRNGVDPGTTLHDVEVIIHPEHPSSFFATAFDVTQIDLSWNQETGMDYTLVRYRNDTYPTAIDDGTELYFGQDTFVSHEGLNPGDHVYYSAWGYDSGSGLYSLIYISTDEETPLENNPPYVPSDPFPSDGAVDIPINTDIAWTGGDPDPGDIVTYDIYFGPISPPPLVDTGYSTTTYHPGILDYEKTYYWQIVAWDNQGESTDGPFWQFTTMETPEYELSGSIYYEGEDQGDLITLLFDEFPNENSVPYNGQLISAPVDFPYDYTFPVFDGSWYAVAFLDLNFNMTFEVDEPVGCAINKTPGFADEIIIAGVDVTGNDITLEVYSPAENNPPYEPSAPLPSDGATNIARDSDLSWTGGDPDSGDTVTFDVYFGSVNPPPKVSDNQSATTYDPGIFEYLATYYWKIIAWDDHGASTPGPVWSFITIDQDTEPPSKVTGLSVTDAKDGKLDLSWDPATDNVAVAYYNIYRDGAGTPLTTVAHPMTSYQDTGLTNGQQYTYEVSAVDTSSNEGEKSDPASGTPTASPSPPPPPPPPPAIQNKPPVADGSAGEPYVGVIGSIITFDGSLSYDPDTGGEIVSWFWDFGDGTNASGEIVNHSYAQATNYTVILTVTDNDAATDDYVTNAVISQPNRAPFPPVIDGETQGTKNTEYTYTAVSTDGDNDTIQYTFDWDDETTDTSDFLPNGTAASFNHSWSAAGKYTLLVTASDNQTTSLGELIIYIDAVNVCDRGYFTDDDGDGVYDLFHGDSVETAVELTEDEQYLYDEDGDGVWDYVYDTTTQECTAYTPPTKEEYDYTWLLLLLLLIIILGILLYIYMRRKTTPKKTKKQ